MRPSRASLTAVLTGLGLALHFPMARADIFTTKNPMNVAREYHTATLLPNGKVLVAGGRNSTGCLSSAEIYDPATGNWTATTSMSTPRCNHTATLTTSGYAAGSVLVAGGVNSGPDYLTSAEMYNPNTGQWTPWVSMYVGRANHTATMMADGRVLVAGGNITNQPAPPPPDPGKPGLGGPGPMTPIAQVTAAVEIYDPVRRNWFQVNSLNTARCNHAAVLLGNGQVLVAGGDGGNYQYLNSAEVYDPQSGTWAMTRSMNDFRLFPRAVLLPSGKALVAGGWSGSQYLNTSDLYDAVNQTWTRIGMTAPRYLGAMLLAGGQPLMIGGYNGSTYLVSSELYNPATQTWTANGNTAVGRQNHTATPLNDGTVLVAGGYNSTDGFLATAEVFSPGWDGMYADGTYPPDPHGAAGYYGILQTVNKRMHYYGKDGTQWETSLTSLFGATGFTGDVKAIYDTRAGANGHFYVIMEEDHDSSCYGTSDISYCNLAVSKDANPTDGTSGGTSPSWKIYKINITQTTHIPPGTTQTYGGDYPGLGVDDNALYITYNMFRLYDPVDYPYCLNPEPCSTVTAYDSQIFALKKSDLNTWAASPFMNTLNTASWGQQDQGFSLQPATPTGGSPGDMAFFAEVPVGTSLPVPPTAAVRVWKLNHPLSASPTLTRQQGMVASNLGGQQCYQGAPQRQPSGVRLSTVEGNRTINAVWNNNLVWFCSTAGGTARALPYWYCVDVSNFDTGVNATAGSIDPGTDGSGNALWGFYPTIGANSRGDICLIFCQSSSGSYPAIAYTWRAASDPIAQGFRPVQVLKQSSSAYHGATSERWGDFGTVTADPGDDTFWISHEYVRTGDNQGWGTWWENLYVP